MLNHIIKANKTVSLHTNNALLLRVRHYFVIAMQQKGCPVDRICADSFSQAAAAVGMPAIVFYPPQPA